MNYCFRCSSPVGTESLNYYNLYCNTCRTERAIANQTESISEMQNKLVSEIISRLQPENSVTFINNHNDYEEITPEGLARAKEFYSKEYKALDPNDYYSTFDLAIGFIILGVYAILGLFGLYAVFKILLFFIQ